MVISSPPVRCRLTSRDYSASLKHASPKGLYVAPVPEQPLLWTGVLFVRKGIAIVLVRSVQHIHSHFPRLSGPYTNAVLRFQIAFPDDYPDRPPIITFLQDVFHPLVTPLTTYTHSTRERGGTVSAADEEKLPPGGLVLREGFPEWFDQDVAEDAQTEGEEPTVSEEGATAQDSAHAAAPHIAQVLQYLRLMFSTPEIIDGVPLTSAANPSAWHAWRSHRAKVLGETRAQSPANKQGGDASSEGSLSPRAAQPGGARRPGEWNWSGVWEDRVRKVVVASRTEGTLFGGGEAGEVVSHAVGTLENASLSWID